MQDVKSACAAQTTQSGCRGPDFRIFCKKLSWEEWRPEYEEPHAVTA